MIFCNINKLYKIKMTESFEIENQEVLLTSNKYNDKLYSMSTLIKPKKLSKKNYPWYNTESNCQEINILQVCVSIFVKSGFAKTQLWLKVIFLLVIDFKNKEQ